jgi:hypothetical protein
MTTQQQIEQLTSAKRRHKLKRNGLIAYEFYIGIVNFLELHSLDKHFSNTSLFDKMCTMPMYAVIPLDRKC